MDLITVVLRILDLIVLVIIADAILSWFQGPDAFPRSLTRKLTEPMYAPIHAILNPSVTGGMDFSPLILIFLIRFLSSTLARASMGGL